MDHKASVESAAQPLGRLFEKLESRFPEDRAVLLRSFAGVLLSRAPADFFRDRDDDDLVNLVVSAFAVLEETPPGQIGVRVRQRPENPHAGTAEVVVGDRPFVVDSLRQYLTSRGFEIKHVLHPVIVAERDEAGGITAVNDWTASGRRVALTYCEFEGQMDADTVGTIEAEIRTCMEDVRLATDDFEPMLRRVDELIDWLREIGGQVPDNGAELGEIIAFLEWLKDDSYIFLGYREYNLEEQPDGRRAVVVERGSGLGILRREEASSAWEPQPIEELPASLQARALFGPLLIVSKANSEARVHRRARMDYVGIKKLDDAGEVVGEHRFLGLLTWKAYSENAGDIPILRRKLQEVLRSENVPEGSHDFKAIVAIFNSMPKEELFLVSIGDLRRQIRAVMDSEDTGEVRLVLTPDVLGRGVNAMVILPERNYSDEVRSRLRSELVEALGGIVLNDYLALGEAETAHLHFYLSASPDRIEEIDLDALESRVAGVVRTWKQRLRGALEDRHRAEDAHRLAETYLEAFTPEYVATVEVDTAVEDIDRLELLERSGLMQVSVEPHRDSDLEASLLRLFVEHGTLILADVMPKLEQLGPRVLQADTMDVGSADADTGPATIHSFVVQGPDRRPLDLERARSLLSEALLAVRAGLTDDDPLNSLVINAGLRWPEVSVLRAYSAYAFQIGAVSSRRAVLDALTEHPRPARLLFEGFRVRFDPDFEGEREEAIAAATTDFLESLSQVDSIGYDHTFRRLHNLVESTVRTNYFQSQARTRSIPHITLKFDCSAVAQMPRPRPATEMYIHGPRTEGAHLRFGPVARGGIRWSERRDDFRTEVLGLVKTQQVKNAVIVPVGAKGVFVVRQPPTSREALDDALRASYEDLIRGLLDVTDNVKRGQVVHPPQTVIYDPEDAYLVVAADKGTARLSDTANELAADYDYWLGDAFASGGSRGYDHKKHGITARGVWECVRRHFREIGKDIDAEPVSVIGIGDMTGDVFGNGMLLSRTLRLQAAFDHRHVFIDPDPDPEASYEERRRLSELPGSTWADYDTSVLSKGGGIYPRGAKSIDLSSEARQLLKLGDEPVNGPALIRAILSMPAELLWNGGIGTYVKAGSETDAEVGDSSNDPVRVNADELGVRIVGEGGNLGLTQKARIEYALGGGRVNTDAVDNSAGVDMSDHEVNLKILLDALVDRGMLTRDDRNELLEKCAEEVVRDVLADNRSQSRALSLEQLRADDRVIEFRDAMYYLQRQAGLDPALEYLPGWDVLQDRQEAGRTLTRPELAVLLAYSKMHLKRELLESDLPDDPAFVQLAAQYFPDLAVERCGLDELRNHRLQREIIATVLSNRIVDIMGSTFIPRVSRDTGTPVSEVARGWYVAAEIAGAYELVKALEESEHRLPAEQEYQWFLSLETVLDRTVRWAVENLPEEAGIGGTIEMFKEPVSELCAALPTIIGESQRGEFEEAWGELKAMGVAPGAAQNLAALRFLEELMEVARLSRQVDFAVPDVGRAYFALADEVDFTWLLELLDMAPGEDVWEQRAAQGLMQDLGQARRNLTFGILRSGDGRRSVGELLDRFRAEHASRLQSMQGFLEELLLAEHINLAALTVVTREILRESKQVLGRST